MPQAEKRAWKLSLENFACYKRVWNWNLLVFWRNLMPKWEITRKRRCWCLLLNLDGVLYMNFVFGKLKRDKNWRRKLERCKEKWIWMNYGVLIGGMRSFFAKKKIQKTPQQLFGFKFAIFFTKNFSTANFLKKKYLPCQRPKHIGSSMTREPRARARHMPGWECPIGRLTHLPVWHAWYIVWLMIYYKEIIKIWANNNVVYRYK